MPPKIIFDSKTGLTKEDNITPLARAAKGDQEIELRCKAQGDTPITVTWNKNGHNVLSGRDKGRYLMTTFSILPEKGASGVFARSAKSEMMTYKGVMSVLKIKKVLKSDEGIYGCGMTNPYGTDVAEIKLMVQEPPNPPKDIKVHEIGSMMARLSWSEDTRVKPHYQLDGMDALPVDEYEVQFASIQGKKQKNTM